MEVEVNFAETLRMARLRRHESQETAASKMGIGQMQLSRIERRLRYPDPPQYKGIARYLGVSVNELKRLVEDEQLAAREAVLKAELDQIHSQRVSLMRLD